MAVGRRGSSQKGGEWHPSAEEPANLSPLVAQHSWSNPTVRKGAHLLAVSCTACLSVSCGDPASSVSGASRCCPVELRPWTDTEKEQKRASSLSPPPRWKPCGMAAWQESNEGSNAPPWSLQVEKGVAQAKLFIASADGLRSGFRSDVEGIPLDFNLSSASSRFRGYLVTAATK